MPSIRIKNETDEDIVIPAGRGVHLFGEGGTQRIGSNRARTFTVEAIDKEAYYDRPRG